MTRSRTPLSVAILLCSALAGACGGTDPYAHFAAGDYHASFKAFRRLADSGDVAAGNFVGIHYYLGAGVARDYATAAQWFERAALAGNADAQRNLGTLYLRGWGVAKNNEHAYGWLFLAHSQGNRRARDYLETTEHLITPNQTMSARRWVAQRMQEGARTPP
jgi:TPR repeat protein